MAEFDDAPLRIGKVTLTVHDLDGVGRFYREVIGLHELRRAGETAAFGTREGTALLELRREPDARAASPREAGLFHAAFLLPTRADLAAWLRHAAASGAPIEGASDHVVSEAIYLSDPEGNGVEVYADRPRATWAWSKDGLLAMRTGPLDVDGLLRAVRADGGAVSAWRGAPAGTTVGHVHLQVGAIAAAEAFYRDVLGMGVMARYPGASFFGSGGYHHHLAVNVWSSGGALRRDHTTPTTGLAGIELRSRDATAFRAVADRVAAADLDVATPTSAAGHLVLRDPWGTPMQITQGAKQGDVADEARQPASGG
jgi:catechol 2,3-dioxygenase